MKKLIVLIFVIFLCNTALSGQNTITSSQLVGKEYSGMVDFAKMMGNSEIQQALDKEAESEEKKEAAKMMASLFKGRIIFTFKNNNKLRMSFRAIFDDAKAKEMGLSLAKRIAIKSAIKTATLMASETVKYEISGNNIISDNDVLGTLSNDLSTFTLKEHGQESEMEIVCRLSK